MNNKTTLRFKLMMCLVLVVTLIMSSVTMAFADNAAESSSANALPNNTISLGGSSTLTVTDIMLFPTLQGNQLVLKADVHNGNSTNLLFNYYWLNVRTKQGNKYDVKILDNVSMSVLPNSTKEFTFTSIVDDSVTLQDIIIEFIQFDFSLPNYERSLGTLSIPDTYKQSVEWSDGKEINDNNSSYLIKGNRFISDVSNTNYDISINLLVENNGKLNVAIPNYNYYIQTKDGLIYPLELVTSDINVLPGERQNIILEGRVPTSAEPVDWKLAVTLPQDDNELPVMIMDLPNESETTELGRVIHYDGDAGNYTIRLEGVQRLPNVDKDIVSIRISVTNLENESPIEVLSLTGALELDGIKSETDDIQGVKLEQLLNIRPNQSVNYVFNAEIPYTYDFTDIMLNLYETKGETTTSVGALKFDTSDISLPFITRSTDIGVQGNRSRVELLRKETYTDDYQQLVNAEVVLTNLEYRSIQQKQLVGTFVVNEEYYYRAEIPENSHTLTPSGKMLVPVTAMIPVEIEIESIELLLGSKVDDSEMYQNGFLLYLPEDQRDDIGDFENISISNYTLGMKNMWAVIQNGVLTFKFDYDLKEQVFQQNLADHKLLIELVNDNTRLTYEIDIREELSVNDSNYEVEIPINQSEFIRDLIGYKLNIYDSYEGFTKLKATRTFRNWDIK